MQRATSNRIQSTTQSYDASDRKILRSLAYRYADVSLESRNAEKRDLHRASNDLKMKRPVVLIDELPWNEMNIDNALTLQCEDPYLRSVEWSLRTALYKRKYFPADAFFPHFVRVQKVVESSGIGIEVKEETLSVDPTNHIVAHHYNDLLAIEGELEKLHLPEIRYNEAETMRRYSLLGELIGDILPIRLSGLDTFYVVVWDDIACYRGVTNLLMDLADRPDFMHQIADKLFQIERSYLDQMENLGLLDIGGDLLHCTPMLTGDLPGKDFDGNKVTRKDIWGRGAAQIFASVSKTMHEEFDIEYMIPTIGQCGLTYYGCCEPLDKKIDIVERIPNLRKISITPWANVDIAAEAIGKKYVLASKPNPASVAVPMLDGENLKKEIKRILDAGKRNGCAMDIVLKDISTCNGRPQNIFEWEKIVMAMVESY